MMRLSRFWQLFLRQFLLLALVSGGIIAFFFIEHAFPQHSTVDWLLFAIVDAAAILAASAISAWLKLYAQRRRTQR